MIRLGRQQTVQSSVKVWREPPLGSAKTSLSSPQNAHAYVTPSFYAVSSRSAGAVGGHGDGLDIDPISNFDRAHEVELRA